MLFLEEIERQASNGNSLNGDAFAWLEEFCTLNESDTAFESSFRMHLRKELGVLEALRGIDESKSFVTYAKKSGLYAHLEERLKGPPETRWNAKRTMLKSFGKYVKKVMR